MCRSHVKCYSEGTKNVFVLKTSKVVPDLINVKAKQNYSLHNKNDLRMLIELVNQNDVGIFSSWLQKHYEANHEFSIGGIMPGIKYLTSIQIIVMIIRSIIITIFFAESQEFRMGVIIEFEEVGEVLQKFLIEELAIHLVLGFIRKLIDNGLVLLLGQRMISIILPSVVKILLNLLFYVFIDWHAVVELLQKPKEFRQLVTFFILQF